jgi:REP element-mobilizing transposase RayT
MPQSLANVHVHLIFSTKGRERWITDGVREALHAYMARVLQNLDCQVTSINSVEDHVHLLFDLGRKVSVSEVVEKVKTSSSKWMKEQGSGREEFAWQAGYGAFGVSASNIEAVREYVVNQREHHRKRTFQEEYRVFMERHGLAMDERYAWD